MDVIIIEDDARLRNLFGLALRGRGHTVRMAPTAALARQHLLVRPADAVLLDLDLGGESGLSVATLAAYVNPDTRAVVVTGSKLFPRGELFEIVPACAAILRKPVDLRDLVAVIEHRPRHKKAATPARDAAA